MKQAEIKTGKIYKMRVLGENEYIDIDAICVVYSVEEKCGLKMLSLNGHIENCQLDKRCIGDPAHRKEAKEFRKKAIKALKKRKLPKDIQKKLIKEIHIWFQVHH